MGFFQGRRQVLIPMWAGLAGNGLNVVLDLWLIFGWAGVDAFGRTWLAVPAMGVEGAAIATSIGTTLTMLIHVIMLVGPRDHRRRFRIHVPRRPDWTQLRRVVRVGAPAAWENFVDMSGFMLFSVVIGTLGASALAANQITVHLLSFVFMPMWGLTTAGAVLTGNWIGAGRHDQAAAYARQVYKLGIYYMLALGTLFLLLRPWLFRIFSDDPAVLVLGPALVLVIAFFAVPDGLRMVSVGVLQGAGDTRYPMYASMAVLWGLFVPGTWWLVIRQQGEQRPGLDLGPRLLRGHGGGPLRAVPQLPLAEGADLRDRPVADRRAGGPKIGNRSRGRPRTMQALTAGRVAGMCREANGLCLTILMIPWPSPWSMRRSSALGRLRPGVADPPGHQKPIERQRHHADGPGLPVAGSVAGPVRLPAASGSPPWAG